MSTEKGVHTHTLDDGTVITHSHEHEHDHGHTHSHTHTKAVLNRLSRAIGHMESIKRMVESGRDCTEVLIQLSAVKSAINNTGKIILQDHIEHCIVDAVDHGDKVALKELEKAIDRFMKLKNKNRGEMKWQKNAAVQHATNQAVRDASTRIIPRVFRRR